MDAEPIKNHVHLATPTPVAAAVIMMTIIIIMIMIATISPYPSSFAVAATPDLCAQIFSAPAPRTPFATRIASLAAMIKARAIGSRTPHHFDAELFHAERERYFQAINLQAQASELPPSRTLRAESVPESMIPTTPEAKLALLEAAAAVNGYGLHHIADTLKSLPPDATQEFFRSLKRVDFKHLTDSGRVELSAQLSSDGIRASTVVDAFVRLYRLANSDPSQAYSIFKTDVPAAEKELIRQRIEMELGTTSLLQALENLGLLRGPDTGLRARLLQALHEYPNAVEVVKSAAVNALTWNLLDTPALPPDIKLLKTKSLTPELQAKLRHNSFESLYPELRAHFGFRAGFDLRWQLARRIMVMGLMVYVLSQSANVLLQSLLPPGYVDEDEDLVRTLEAIRRYWYGIGRAVTGADPDPSDADLAEIRQLIDDLKRDDFGQNDERPSESK